MKNRLIWFVAGLLALTAAAPAGAKMTLASPAFQNGQVLPESMIFNHGANNVNLCTADSHKGGDTSPALTWTGLPPATESLVVIMQDTTASFTHWGMYNIPPTAAGLPAGAGKPGKPDQIFNNFGIAGYSGPCPPLNFRPVSHQYVITVYALGTKLTIAPQGDFPANEQTLLRALVAAGANGQILGSASLAGTYASAPGAP